MKTKFFPLAVALLLWVSVAPSHAWWSVPLYYTGGDSSHYEIAHAAVNLLDVSMYPDIAKFRFLNPDAGNGIIPWMSGGTDDANAHGRKYEKEFGVTAADYDGGPIYRWLGVNSVEFDHPNDGVLPQYKAFNFVDGEYSSYYYLALMAHLVADQAVPAHAANIRHVSPMVDMTFPSLYGDNFENTASTQKPRQCIACHATPPIKSMNVGTVVEYYMSPSEGIIASTQAQIPSWRDASGNPYWIASNRYVGAAFDESWGRYGILKFGGDSSDPLDYVDSYRADADTQDIVQSQFAESVAYVAGFLAAASKSLPPLVKNFQISSANETNPRIDAIKGTSVQFQILENRDPYVFLTIKAKGKSSPNTECVIRERFMLHLNAGNDLPYEGNFTMNAWKGECADGTLLPDGKYSIKVEVEDNDRNEVNAVFPDINTDSIRQNDTSRDFEIVTVPGAPITLRAEAGNAKVHLSWTRPTMNADGSTLTDLLGYELHYSTRMPNDPNAVVVGPILPSGEESEAFDLGPLLNGKSYFVSVRARDTLGNRSGYTEWISSRPMDAIWVHYPGKISDALALARSGDRVMVGPGSYHESSLNIGRSTIFWEATNIILQSEQGPGKTFIDGGSNGSMSINVGDKSKIIGFTLMNSAWRSIDCQFAEDVLIANNIFVANAVGVAVAGMRSELKQSVRIYNNVFVGNVRAVTGYMNYSILDLQNNIFRGVRGDETGLYLEYSRGAVLNNNNFYGNGKDIVFHEYAPFDRNSSKCAPGFVALDRTHPESGNYTLNQGDSCARNQGSPAFTSDGVIWQDCDGSETDLGAFGGPFAVVDNNANGISDCQEPVGRPVALAVFKNSANQPLTLVAQNPEQADLAYAITTPPSHGALSGTPPILAYTPEIDFSGDDEAEYVVTNQHGNSPPAPVKIGVKASNVPPVAMNQTVIVEPLQMGVVTLQGTDEDGDNLTYVLDSNPTSGALVYVHPPDCYFLPYETTRGAVNFTYHVSDGFADSAPASVTMIVNAAPTISLLTPALAEQMSNSTSFVINWVDEDPDNDATISIYYDTDGDNFDGTLVAMNISEDDPGNSYLWQNEDLPDGIYYIYAVILDGFSTSRAYAPGPMTIDRTPPAVSIDPESGIYRGPLQAALSTSEPATIHFTSDGSEPTLSSPIYGEKITVSDSLTIRWTAIDAAGNQGPEGSATYLVDDVPPAVSVVPLPNSWQLATITITGRMETGATVSLSADRDARIGAVIYPSASTWECIVSDLLGGPVGFTATARDLAGNAATATTWTSIVLNQPPSLGPIGDQIAFEDRQFSLTVIASDPDGTISMISAVPLPAGSAFNGTVFSWRPGYDQSGTYSVTFTADDGRLSCSETITIRVLDVNRAPTVPVVSAPRTQGEVLTDRPSLDLEGSTDPDGDLLFYEYELYSDAGLTQLFLGSGLLPGTDAGMSWRVTLGLTDNTWYWWRARSGDGRSLSQWTEGAGFFVNLSNDPPGGFSTSEPPDNTEVASLTPQLGVNNSRDVDGDVVSYSFLVYADVGMSQLVASVGGVSAEAAGFTSWRIGSALMDNTWYHWRAVAADEHGAATESGAAAFFVNLANEPPGLPTVQSPLDGAELTTLDVALEVLNATDPEYDSLAYYFEIDTLPTFDGQGMRKSHAVSEEMGSTAWPVTGLTDNSLYFWRVRASDGLADSAWTSSSFFMNAANDIPSTVVVRNPGAGAWVDSVTPRLEVYAASDPDRDRLEYIYQVFSEAPAGLVAEGRSTDTVWVPHQALEDNAWYTWRASAVDEHGLVGAWSDLVPFFVNNNGIDDPPTITIIEPSTGYLTNGETFTIEWADGDQDSDADIALYRDADADGLDGEPIAYGIKEDADGGADRYQWDVRGVPEGTWWVYGVILDGASTRVSYGLGSITIDSQAPATSLSPQPGIYTGPVTVTMTATDGRDPSPTIYYTDDGSPPTFQSTRYAGPFTITRTTELRYFAVDNAGEQEASQGPALYEVRQAYVISASAGPGGTITPGGLVAVQPHADQIFTVTPNANYRIAALTVDGQSVTSLPGAYFFEDVSANHTITATFSPFTEVTLVDPSGGEVMSTGSTATIRYGGPSTAAKYRLEYTTNNGSSYTTIADGATGYAYSWAVPRLTANSAQCRVRVTGLNAKGKSLGSDVSDQPFAIEVVRLAKPNGGEAIKSGSPTPITWVTHATAAPVSRVDLSYSTTGGCSWIPIATLNSNPGTYTWAVPATVAGVNCRVRVQLFNGKTALGSDASDHALTIAR